MSLDNHFDIRDIDVRYSPARYIYPHATDKDKIVIQPPGHRNLYLQFPGGDVLRIKDAQTISTATLDTGVLENGKDYNTYACYDDGQLAFLNSKALTYPAGYTADEVLLIGGYHTLCMNVGTISGHLLSGYSAGDITPTSIWDLKHRAANLDNRGLAYHPLIRLWLQIYESSDNGVGGVQSVNGATILDTLGQNEFMKKGQAVGMRLLSHDEFYRASLGSNQQTNIAGGADPVTAGGSLDTAGRAMVNDYGHWRLCGSLWTWLADLYYKFKGATSHTHTENTATSYTQNAVTSAPSVAMTPPFAYYDDGAGEGKEHIQTESNIALLAGGTWTTGANAGSRCRTAAYRRSDAYPDFSARFACESL